MNTVLYANYSSIKKWKKSQSHQVIRWHKDSQIWYSPAPLPWRAYLKERRWWHGRVGPSCPAPTHLDAPIPGCHPPHGALQVHTAWCVCLQICAHVCVSLWVLAYTLYVSCLGMNVLSPQTDQHLKGRPHDLRGNTSAIHSSPLWKPQIPRKPLVALSPYAENNTWHVARAL